MVNDIDVLFEHDNSRESISPAAGDQNKITGKLVATGRVAWQQFGDKEDQKGYVFAQNQGYALKIDPSEMEALGISQDALMDCVKQLEDMGDEEVKKHINAKQGQGYKANGLVIQSQIDPRLKMSVMLHSVDYEDASLLLEWYFDDEKLDAEQKTTSDNYKPERKVDAEELKAVEKAREAADLQLPKEMVTIPIMGVQSDAYKKESNDMKDLEHLEYVLGLGTPLSEDVNQKFKSHKEEYLPEATAVDKKVLTEDSAQEMQVIDVVPMKNQLELKGRDGKVSYYKLPANQKAKDYARGDSVSVSDGKISKMAKESITQEAGDHFPDVTIDLNHPEMMKVLSKTPSGQSDSIAKLRMKQLKDLLKKQDGKVKLSSIRGKSAYIVDHPGSSMEIPRAAIIMKNREESKETTEGTKMAKDISLEEACGYVDFWGVPKALTEDSYTYVGQAIEKPKSSEGTEYGEKAAGKPEYSKTVKEYDSEEARLAGTLGKTDDNTKMTVQAGNALEKPHSTVGTEYGQKELDKKNIKVGEKPEAGRGEEVKGTGAADATKDQEMDVAKNKIKVGAPGTDHGEHVSEDAHPEMKKDECDDEDEKMAEASYETAMKEWPKKYGKKTEDQELSDPQSATSMVQKPSQMMMNQSKKPAMKRKLPEWAKKGYVKK